MLHNTRYTRTLETGNGRKGGSFVIVQESNLTSLGIDPQTSARLGPQQKKEKIIQIQNQLVS